MLQRFSARAPGLGLTDGVGEMDMEDDTVQLDQLYCSTYCFCRLEMTAFDQCESSAEPEDMTRRTVAGHTMPWLFGHWVLEPFCQSNRSEIDRRSGRYGWNDTVRLDQPYYVVLCLLGALGPIGALKQRLRMQQNALLPDA